MESNLRNRLKVEQIFLSEHRKIYSIVLSIITIIIFTILMIGCFNQSDDKEDIHQINERAIEAVLRSSFTCPRLVSWEAIEKSHEGMTIIGKEDNTKSSEKNLMESELKSLYGSFLTEKYYDLFIGKHALTYELAAYRAGYEINVNSINISPSENDSIGYHFVVSVTYGKNNEEKSIAEITGNAQCLEDGKVSYINYTGDSGLLENMKYNIGQ